MLLEKSHGSEEIFQAKIKKYWQQTGYKNYCAYLSNGNPMLSGEELSLLCDFLHIPLEVYAPDTDEGEINYATPQTLFSGYSGAQSVGSLSVANDNNHWQRLISDNEKLARHKVDVQSPSVLASLGHVSLILPQIIAGFQGTY